MERKKQEFSKILGYQINNQRSIEFQYNSSEQPKNEMEFFKNSIDNSIEKIKHLGINKKIVQFIYSENYKKLLKSIKENLKKWKDIPCSWIRRP
jgi:hypothetical protein